MGKRGAKPGAMKGRHSCILIHYTEENYDEVLERISKGETLNKICQSPHLPNRDAILKRSKANPEFAKRYEEAQALRCGVIEDQIQEIADDISRDHTPAAVYRAKVQIDARKWLLAIKHPDKYAQYNRQQIKHEGVQGLPTPVINISYDGVIDVTASTDGSADQSSPSPQAEDSTTEFCN